MKDSSGKFGIDQLNQATDDEKRHMKQAEQAKAFPENMLPVEKPSRIIHIPIAARLVLPLSPRHILAMTGQAAPPLPSPYYDTEPPAELNRGHSKGWGGGEGTRRPLWLPWGGVEPLAQPSPWTLPLLQSLSFPH